MVEALQSTALQPSLSLAEKVLAQADELSLAAEQSNPFAFQIGPVSKASLAAMVEKFDLDHTLIERVCKVSLEGGSVATETLWQIHATSRRDLYHVEIAEKDYLLAVGSKRFFVKFGDFVSANTNPDYDLP